MEEDDARASDELFDWWIAEIDSDLQESGVPIFARTVKAAMLFVDRCVLDVQGGTKEDYIEQLWFKALYRMIERWYRTKYGEALKQPIEPLVGVAFLAGTAFTINVPRTVSRVEEPGKAAWLIFPADVQDGEDPLDWIIAPPNLQALGDEERQQTRAQVGEIGACLRSTHVDLMTATRRDEESEALAHKVLGHLVAVAAHLPDPYRRYLGLAIWESHQAAESALKLLCRQDNETHKKIHEIVELYDSIGADKKKKIDRALALLLPVHKEAIRLRAGEGVPPTLLDAQESYLASIRLVTQCAASLERKVVVRNAGFLLKKWPFFD